MRMELRGEAVGLTTIPDARALHEKPEPLGRAALAFGIFICAVVNIITIATTATEY